jgi:hypothetical protein
MSFDEPEGLDFPDNIIDKKIAEIKTSVDGSVEKKKVESVSVIESDFEQEKEKLRKQKTEHGDPDKPYVTIDIPDTGKLGEKLTIKLSKKVPNIQLGFGDGIIWEREIRYDPKSPKVVKLKPTILIDEHRGKFNDDVINIELGDIKTVAGKEIQSWLEGDYLVEIRAFGNESFEETSARKLVKISG